MKGKRCLVLKGGSPAIHKLGDIYRDEDDYIDVFEETNDEYIGMFCEGLGFANVRFQKKDTRPLTPEEIADINTKYYAINSTIYGKIHLDADGYYIHDGGV